MFHVVLWVRSAVLLYFLDLGLNLLFLVSSGKRRIGRKMVCCQTLRLRQRTVNLACHEDVTIALSGISPLQLPQFGRASHLPWYSVVF